MKIAIAINTSWNIYHFRMGLINRLMQEGYEVHTIAPIDGHTHLLTAAGCIHHNIAIQSCRGNVFQDFRTVIRMWHIYKKVKPDAVLHYTMKPNIYGSIAAFLLNIPTINNVCGIGTLFLHKSIVSTIGTILCWCTFRFSKRTFFQNIDDLNLFVAKKIVSKKAVDLIPGSGIDLNRFSPVRFRRNKIFTFLLISRLIMDKGVVEYIEAARQLKKVGINSRFQLLGPKDEAHIRGVKSALVDKWIEEGTVEYLGTTHDVRPFIAQADCIVLPSYREGTPKVLLEAASSSKPIITTNVPGCRQVVDNEVNGLLCKSKDADDLADKMMAMAGFDDGVLKKLGENGREKIKAEYAENIVIDKYIKTLSSFKKNP